MNYQLVVPNNQMGGADGHGLEKKGRCSNQFSLSSPRFHPPYHPPFLYSGLM